MGLGKANDILFAITTSGESINIVKAIKLAKKMKIKVILLTSAKGKKLEKFCDVLLDCPGNRVDRIQEMQKVVGHIVCENIESILN